MDNRMIHFFILALLSSPCSAAPVSETFTVSVRSPVSVQRGQTAILPCWLTPSQSAEDMEVRWYQGNDQYDTPVLLYKERAFDHSSQQASYAGRVSLGLKEETSGGLKAGDVSLKLENVTIKDAGQYNCYASSSKDYESATINLSVTETGGQPLLSVAMKDDNKVNISCQSDGWYPQPELRWSEGEKDLTPADVLFSKNSAGFYSVHSWVLVSSPSEVSCSVGLINEAPKEARMRLENPPPSQEGSSAGWVAFVILLVAVLAALGALCFLYFRKKANKSKPGNDTTDGAELMSSPEENEPLLSKASPHSAVLLEASKYYVVMFMSPLTHWSPMGKQRVTIAALTGNRMIYFWFLVLLSSPGCAAPVSETFTVSVKSHVSVQRGQTAILPCWLTFSQSAEDMEVRWNHWSHEFGTAVLLYKERAFDHSSQQASYAGRVSFGLKEETSGGLKAGDVSLKLKKVTIEDAGKYKCSVSSSDDYDSATISLSVTETGGQPLLSAVMKDDNKVNMSCQSAGWYPQPELRWSYSKKALRPADVIFSKNSAGSYSVHSWVLVSNPSEVSCSVGLINEAPKEARMCLENPPPSPNHVPLEESGSSAGWVAFVILLAAVLAALGALCFLYFRKKANKPKPGNDTTDEAELMNSPEENEPLLSKAATWHPAVLLEASKYYENIQLVETNNELIKIRGCRLRENIHVEFPDGERVTCLTAVRGSPGFSSGRHYWEVCLQMSAKVGLKKSWWIGVTDKHEIPLHESFPPTTKNGFWFLSSCPNQEDTVQFSTEPETFIYVQSKPKTVGVYLDFDNRELSFYNVEEKCLIGSLAAEFTGELFPLFNSGKGDLSSMKIIQRPVQDQSNNTEPVENLQKVEENQSSKTENAEEDNKK